MKRLLFVVILIFFTVPTLPAEEVGGEDFKSSEQITKDLMVTGGTRGISVRPHESPGYSSSAAVVSEGELETQSSEGRVDLYIQFEYAKASLTGQSQKQLKELAVAMGDTNLVNDVFLIAGHTDAVGSDSYNMELSEKRARAVVEYLTKHLGVRAERLVARGFGERLLKDKQSPKSGVNRRVEVVNTRVLQ